MKRTPLYWESHYSMTSEGDFEEPALVGPTAPRSREQAAKAELA